MKFKTSLLLALIFVSIQASFAFAHKVIIFAWVEEGMIHSQSSFGSKRKARSCAIIVSDEKNNIIHEGKTNDQGEYSFKIPENIESDLVLTLDAGTGHKGQWKISKKEMASDPSINDIQAAQNKKEELEQQPSIFKIMGGIGIIILLASALKLFKRNDS
ncbi:MAG: hypothetical protein GY699_25375 [Desulfobacteraceae bacterium]|nr:hypothetical protein [Desulfobacteraceae bacterium]